MKALQEEMKRQLTNLNPKMIRRYLHDMIDWDARLISILGARGVGKTTLLLQHIQETGDIEHSLFVFADNIYFTTHTLLDLTGAFYRNGGKYLYIDEIHKYPNWSTEIKNIYDSYPTLKVVYTGSSILGMSRNDISDLFYYLEKAGMIARLRQATVGISLLGKVDKVYLNNTNLMYLLASDNTEIGNVRETFFLSATQVTERVLASIISDFQIGEYTFEVGGKKKGKKQLAEATHGIVVRDDIEYYSTDIVPLFAFGLLY